MLGRRGLIIFFTAWLATTLNVPGGKATAEETKIGTLSELFARLESCWRWPELPFGNPGMQITVLVSFTRSGAILGRPKVTYESEYASDNDRLLYRTAVAEALQRCTPMPFTDGLGSAVAGRPLRIRFDGRRTKSTEKRSWQTTTTL
jgi:hypothetical protein